MVAVGCFSARLVEADTGRPFREHVGPHHGQHYVETEPDAEYFIEIQVLHGAAEYTEYNVVYCIDGQDLGFYTQISQMDGPHLVGLCSRENGQTIKKAIRCVSPKISAVTQPQSTDSLTPPVSMMGTVTVKFSEAICTGNVKQQAKNYDSSQALIGATPIPRHPAVASSGSQKKKVLRSAEGSASITSNKRGRKKFNPGILLQEINLQYCTALGLIYAGVLEKPPLWDMHRSNNNKCSNHHHHHNNNNNNNIKEETNTAAPHHSCKRVKIGSVFDGSTMLAAPKEYDVIEFLDDDDDDNNDESDAGNAVTVKEEEENVVVDKK